MVQTLVIEDQYLIRLSLMEQICAAFFDSFVVGTEHLELAIRELEARDYDIVVIDPELPRVDSTSPQDRKQVVARIVAAAPGATHIVVTGSDDRCEINEMRALGIAAYLDKVGLDPELFVDLLKEISARRFTIRLSETAMTVPDYRYSYLTPREQTIISAMTRRPPKKKRKEVFAMVAERFGIDSDSVRGYYKSGRAKIMKYGHGLPRELT